MIENQDDFGVDTKSWKLIKNAKDWQTGEEKRLYQSSNKYLITWQWQKCSHVNQKRMVDRKKAFRLYDCITISGWRESA